MQVLATVAGNIRMQTGPGGGQPAHYYWCLSQAEGSSFSLASIGAKHRANQALLLTLSPPTRQRKSLGVWRSGVEDPGAHPSHPLPSPGCLQQCAIPLSALCEAQIGRLGGQLGLVARGVGSD